LKKGLLVLIVAAAMFAGYSLPKADAPEADPTAPARSESALPEAAMPESPLLRHVVLFKFKDSSTEAAVDSVEAAVLALPDQIDVIAGFEWGTNNSPEGLNDGFTHCFFVSFESEEDRAVYLPHPAHQAFVGVLRPHLDKVLVIDYWAQE
jgi:hypothetical protein